MDPGLRRDGDDLGNRGTAMTELVFRDDAYARSCAARATGADERGIRLDRTVFYPTGGGQPRDTGVLKRADSTAIAIVDARKRDGLDDVLHVAAPGSALPAAGEKLLAEIAWERRYRLIRVHTGLQP